MKNLLLSLVLLFSVSAFAQETEKEAIKSVIQSAYVDGIQNRGNIQDIENGFHPGFNLLGVDKNNHLTKFPIYTWKDFVKKSKESGKKKDHKTTAQYPMIEVVGNAAVAKVELYREDKKIFTDFLSLYKFEEGWRIVSKIYHRH